MNRLRIIFSAFLILFAVFSVDASGKSKGKGKGKGEDSREDEHVVWYDLNVIESFLGPNGYFQTYLTFNGQYPGPTLNATVGDTIVVNVHNHLMARTTTIHWYAKKPDDVYSFT
jgi:hypothetical protein